MTPRSKVLLVSTLVASIGAAGLATASFAGKGHYGDHGYHGGKYGKGHMSLLANLDTDGDGKLTQAEITEEMQERLVTFDGDGMFAPSDRRHHEKHKYHDDYDDDQDDH